MEANIRQRGPGGASRRPGVVICQQPRPPNLNSVARPASFLIRRPNTSFPPRSVLSRLMRSSPQDVEIADERQKLMFRVKLRVDARVLKEYSRKVKTGVRGVGIVRTKTETAWPEDLQVKLP